MNEFVQHSFLSDSPAASPPEADAAAVRAALATHDPPAPPAAAPAGDEPKPLSPKVLFACHVAIGHEQAGANDEPGSIRSAWRDLNSKGNGDEHYRRVLRAGSSTWEWITDERLPRGTFLASDRRATVKGDVFIGDVVATYSRGLRGGKSTGKATLDGFDLYAGIGADTKPILADVAHKSRRDGKIDLVLPSGHPLTVSSPNW